MTRPELPNPSEAARRFAQAYFELTLETGRDWGIAVQAYRRAFPMDKYLHARSDDRDAQRAAYAWLQNPAVKQMVSELRRDFAKRAPIPESRVLQELERIAVANLDDFLQRDENGNVTVDLSGVGYEQMAAVQEITTTETKDAKGRITRKTNLKLHDKGAALDRLLRVYGSYEVADNFMISAAELERIILSMRRRLNSVIVDSKCVSNAEPLSSATDNPRT